MSKPTASPVDRPVGRLDPKRAALLAQIEACRRDVAGWPAHMRVVATLQLHPAAMEGS